MPSEASKIFIKRCRETLGCAEAESTAAQLRSGTNQSLLFTVQHSARTLLARHRSCSYQPRCHLTTPSQIAYGIKVLPKRELLLYAVRGAKDEAAGYLDRGRPSASPEGLEEEHSLYVLQSGGSISFPRLASSCWGMDAGLSGTGNVSLTMLRRAPNVGLLASSKARLPLRTTLGPWSVVTVSFGI